MRVEFHPLADQELADAARFYEGQASGLGTQFLDEVERLLAVVTTYPDLGSPRSGGVRTVPTRRFPYSLVYRVSGDRLVVVAVAHHRRRPRYWSGRTPAR
jgi:plasmid stabilization system protein ParE